MELIGEYEDSGFVHPPSIVRRSDGQVIQLPDILYRILTLADGSRTLDAIAQATSEAVGRGLSGSDVSFLVDQKLRPMGLLTQADGSSPQLPKPDPFLGLRFRIGVVPERVSGVLGDLFKWLFSPALVVVVLAGLCGVDAWLFFFHGVAQPLRQAIYHPGMFLPLLGGVVLGAAFHETGHAAGCRYGGGHPGRMGCGLYLAWPAFYTDVTDAYRLGKRARLRTDLGGVYFNVVIILASVGVYFVTHIEAVLLLAVIEHFEIAHQLLPIIRLDGYYIIADITGVPDLFARIGPILRSVLRPTRARDPRVAALKPWVRRVVTGWILFVVPLLAFELLVVLVHLPRIMGTAWDAGFHLGHQASGYVGRGRIFTGITYALQVLILAIPVVGIVLMLIRFFTSGSRWVTRRTAGRPVLRTVAVLAALGGAVLLGLSWIPGHNYRPIQPNERGTLTQGAIAVTRLPGGRAPLYSVTHDTLPPTSTTSTTSTTVPSSTTTSGAGSSTSTTRTGSSTTTSVGGTGSSSSTTTSSTTTSTTAPSTTTTSASTSTSGP